MKNAPPNTTLAIHELLGTKNKKEQAERITALMGQINAPVLDLIIRFDGRTNQVGISIVGPDFQLRTLYAMLDAARDMLKKQEYEALEEKQPNAPMPEGDREKLEEDRIHKERVREMKARQGTQ